MALNLLDLKAFGERIAARDPDRLTAEIQIRILCRFIRTGGIHLLSHEPLLGPRDGRDRPRGMMTEGKGGITSQA